jgi:hypothetical protein
MLFEDAELARVVSDPLVLVLRHGNDGTARLVSAFADDVHERDVRSGFVGRPDHLVDLPDDGLVLGNAVLSKAHRPCSRSASEMSTQRYPESALPTAIAGKGLPPG